MGEDSDSDEGGFDIEAAIRAQVNLAEMVYSYFQSLSNAGFNEDQAFEMTMAYQNILMTMILPK